MAAKGTAIADTPIATRINVAKTRLLCILSWTSSTPSIIFSRKVAVVLLSVFYPASYHARVLAGAATALPLELSPIAACYRPTARSKG